MDILVVLKRLAVVLRTRKEEASWPYHLFLTRDLLQHSTEKGYRSLARLIHAGYFSKILTANTDTALESALAEQGLRPPQYEVSTIGEDSDERIAAILDGQESGIHIVKLYGKRSRREPTPSRFKLSSDIQASLEHYFSRNIIIVGRMDQEEEGSFALHAHQERGIYYVLQNPPSLDDIVIESLYKQGKRPHHFLITDPYGEFNTFFSTLETCIKERASQNQAPPTPTDVPKTPQKPPRMSDRTSADVLLVTVTDVEAQAIFDLFPNRSQRFLHGRIYYDLGFVGVAKTFMAQATGAGPAHARICIEAGIQALSPQVVIMVGIAFGLHPGKQKIGDILVSNQIEDYDHQKIGTGPNEQREIYARGDRVGASERLLNRFKAGRHDWPTPPDVHFGLILSGSKLVSHKGFRDELLRFAPEAIGGEMEGTSLYEAWKHTHIEWVLVKAICDWADANKNDAHQTLAAKNAARFVTQVVGQDQFVRQR